MQEKPTQPDRERKKTWLGRRLREALEIAITVWEIVKLIKKK